MASIAGVEFEHYLPANTTGVQETAPRLSWKIVDAPKNFVQTGYEVELREYGLGSDVSLSTATVDSSSSHLVPWPFPNNKLHSRQRISVRIRIKDENHVFGNWSEASHLEVGLLSRDDWVCQRITAPWAAELPGPNPEDLFRKGFHVSGSVEKARLYVTAQGVYEAEINGRIVGDQFLAPGWTTYSGRIQYQTYDVTANITHGVNCLGIRLAEGWFCGRLGWEGGHRNIWGPHPAIMAQLEVTYVDGTVQVVGTDQSWRTAQGPVRLAEIYDGEKYNATLEIPAWSTPTLEEKSIDETKWAPVTVMPPIPDSITLVAGYGEPVRRVQVLKPAGPVIVTPSGKRIIDFGQNLVGNVRLKNVRAPKGHKITLSHAEVLENGELGTRPLRDCKAVDEYTARGDPAGETYEPRFTFHGFRYVQVDGWPGDLDTNSIEAVVCHTDMRPAGSFACSDALLNKLYENVVWGMRGNFFYVPTDCPQRDERLGWTGDIALFVSTAVLIYHCHGMLRNWLIDLEIDQTILNGVPPMVSPNSTLADQKWCRKVPCAIWHDVTVIAPWTLYQETGDVAILAQQYHSMMTWMNVIPKNKTGATHLWDPRPFQLAVSRSILEKQNIPVLFLPLSNFFFLVL